MALRLVELVLPADQNETVEEILTAHGITDPWPRLAHDDLMIVRLLLDAEKTRPVVDAFVDRFESDPSFSAVVLAVEAAVPRPEEVAPAPAPDTPAEARPVVAGISREELQEDIEDMARLSRVFLATVCLSAIVATVGVWQDNVAVIIGAMLIAPLLGPNVALAFASTLGDTGLIRRSLRTNIVGMAVALALATTLGAILPLDVGVEAFQSRTLVGFSDIVLALAAGTACVLAITSGVPSVLAGVMVAVALLPPTVVFCLALGHGAWREAGHAGLLVAANVICVNLAGVATFLVQGIRPRTWWEAGRARRSARLALAIWIGLLLVLATLIVVAPRP